MENDLTPAEKWEAMRQAWETYCAEGPSVLDWDEWNREKMIELTGVSVTYWYRPVEHAQ